MAEKTSPEDSGSVVHYLPCKIAYDGPAPIESYFHPTQSRNNKDLIANFRGRKLIGEKVVLPAHAQGSVVEIIDKDNVIVHSTFKEVHIWEHDLQPDARFLEESFDWLEIADAVSFLPLLLILRSLLSFYLQIHS